MKNTRHARILDIISKKEIETQEELVNALVLEGFKVTQATVSRDIKDLRLTKIPDDRGGYKYTSMDNADTGITPKMKQLFIQTVLNINSANNLIVIKTLAGSANTIGMVVDALKHPNVLGSVAGDDTIIVVASSNEAVPEVLDKLNSLLQ